MPYIASIKNQNYTITTHTQDNQTAVTLNEVTHALDWQRIAALASDEKGRRPEGGYYSLLIAGKSYEVFVRRVVQDDEDGNRQTYEIQLAGQYFLVTVEDERTHTLAGIARSTAASSAARIKAPMPGLVVNTLAQPGDTVSAGQTVVVLEAMKMENDLPSPIAGIVKELKVQKGQTVDQGQLLVIIEGEQPH